MRIYDNFYVRDYLRKIRHYRRNHIIDNIITECEQIDSIKEYHMFKQFIIKHVKEQSKGGFLGRAEYGGEGLHYGHRKAFFDYAGIKCDKQRFLFPHFEHGADLREKILPNVYDSTLHSFVFQSSYKNKMLHRERPLCPIYNVGPYVLYAAQYYDDNTKSELKRKIKKTALLFPAHTFEGAVVTFDKKKFVKDVFGKFKEHYDTIMISVYWNDVDDSIYDMFEAEGAQLVSAGFRGDPNFIVRLRTMIELADVVASNLIGSYIGYSMALKKPFYMFGDRANLYDASNVGSTEEEARYAKTIDCVFDAFSSLTPTRKQLLEQKDIYEKFWGGNEYFKSKEEARDMIILAGKLLKASNGFVQNYEKMIRDALNGGNKANLSVSEMILLKNSLGILE